MTKTANKQKTPDTAPAASVIQMIALSDLTLSKMNPRQRHDADEIAALATSIRTAKLLQNLSGFGPSGSSTVEIVAGGRRLRALQLIAEQDGTDPAETFVPVHITDNNAEAQTWASMENTARKALHPAEEITAYRKMAENGIGTGEIAKAFAVTERHVKGRLRLADLAEPILTALRAGEITLDIAAAYTSNPDPAAQVAVFEEVSGHGWLHNAREVRARLTRDAEDANGKLARFVGRAQYELEGGEVREDLFGTDVWFTDAELLHRLASEKLAAIRDEHLAAGWKWVETCETHPGWDVTGKLGRTYPEQAELTDEQATRYEELAELVECEVASEEDWYEFEELIAALECETFSPEQMAEAGIFLWIGHDGTTETICGLIRDEDRDAAIAAGVMQDNRHRHTQTEPKPKGPYSAALLDDLRKLRTAAAQTALLDHPDLALDLLIFALSTNLYNSTLPLGIATEDAANSPKQDEGLNLPKPLQSQEYSTPMSGTDAASAFIAFRRKRPITKRRILTEAVARLFSIGLTGGNSTPLAELVADLSGIDVRRVWTPTADFLGRLKAKELDAIMAYIDGTNLPSGFQKMKKGEKVRRLHAVFADEPGIPPMTDAQRTRAAAWLPDGMTSSEPIQDCVTEAA